MFPSATRGPCIEDLLPLDCNSYHFGIKVLYSRKKKRHSVDSVSRMCSSCPESGVGCPMQLKNCNVTVPGFFGSAGHRSDFFYQTVLHATFLFRLASKSQSGKVKDRVARRSVFFRTPMRNVLLPPINTTVGDRGFSSPYSFRVSFLSFRHLLSCSDAVAPCWGWGFARVSTAAGSAHPGQIYRLSSDWRPRRTSSGLRRRVRVRVLIA